MTDPDDTDAADPLGTRWAAIEAKRADLGLERYPSVPEDSVEAEWMGDPVELIELAARLGIKLIYSVHSSVKQATLDRIDGQEDLGPALREAMHAALVDHVGETSQVHVAFVLDGVTHVWRTTAAWWEELFGTDEVAGTIATAYPSDTFYEQLEIAYGPLRDAGVADTIARDKRYYGARNNDARFHLVPDLLAELSVTLPDVNVADADEAETARQLGRAIVSEIHRHARLLVPDVRQEVEADLLARVPELAEHLHATTPGWAALAMQDREEYAKAYLLAEYGIGPRTVLRRIARQDMAAGSS